MSFLDPLNIPDDLLDPAFGGRTVRGNLEQAVADGVLRLTEDGRITMTSPKQMGELYLYQSVAEKPQLPCSFLYNFVFKVAFGHATIPWHCRNCYKVKASPPTLKGLLALRTLAGEVPCDAKFGPEPSHIYTQDIYGCYFYCVGLDQAREIFRQVRQATDRHADLGPETPVRIKRGCSLYEMRCGPSHLWTFHPAQEALEQYLWARFAPPAKIKSGGDYATLMRWMEIAYSLGDDSYLDFTKGVRLFPATVGYDPESGAPCVPEAP